MLLLKFKSFKLSTRVKVKISNSIYLFRELSFVHNFFSLFNNFDLKKDRFYIKKNNFFGYKLFNLSKKKT